MNRNRKKCKEYFTKGEKNDIYIERSFEKYTNISGDDNIEEIPVPIPNTEVKLYCADDICGLPC